MSQEHMDLQSENSNRGDQLATQEMDLNHNHPVNSNAEIQEINGVRTSPSSSISGEIYLGEDRNPSYEDDSLSNQSHLGNQVNGYQQIGLAVNQHTVDIAQLKVDTAQLKVDTAQLKVDTAQLKVDVADIKQKLDAILNYLIKEGKSKSSKKPCHFSKIRKFLNTMRRRRQNKSRMQQEQ